jgi:hypothetical protein
MAGRGRSSQSAEKTQSGNVIRFMEEFLTLGLHRYLSSSLWVFIGTSW